MQDLIGLTPGNLITHLRKLEDAGYSTTEKNGSGVTARTSVALTLGGRSALERYSTVLRELLDSATPDNRMLSPGRQPAGRRHDSRHGRNASRSRSARSLGSATAGK